MRKKSVLRSRIDSKIKLYVMVMQPILSYLYRVVHNYLLTWLCESY